MLLFIKIVLGFMVAIAIAIGLGILVFLLIIRKYSGDCAADSTTPLAIHLNEDLVPDWVEEKDVEALIKDFTDLGFARGTAYLIEEMEQVKMISLFHDKYVGVVYQVSGMRYFFDMMHEGKDGHRLTVTTMPFSSDIESPPDKEKLFMADACVTDAFGVIQEKFQNQESVRPGPEKFRESMEQYYKAEQAYRTRNGGLSFAEFQKIAKMEPKRYSEKKIREAYLSLKKDELELWNNAGVEDYFASRSVSDEERYGNGCYFVVPGKTDSEAFVHYLSDFDLVNDDHVEKVAQSVKGNNNIFELFERINNARSPDLRAKEIGVISFPVEGKIYQTAG